jgi:hypothetical protein
VAPPQRPHSVLPMHSACVLRVEQRGQPSSPHSFFWRQKWQVMPGQEGRGGEGQGVASGQTGGQQKWQVMPVRRPGGGGVGGGGGASGAARV